MPSVLPPISPSTVTQLADEIQEQFWSFVHLAQDNVIDALGWVAEPTRAMVPDRVARLASHLPDASKLVDRGFDTAEQWLRTQREFASKVAGTLNLP